MLRSLVLGSIITTSGPAHATPRVMPFLPTPGVRLPGNAQAGTFCSTSQRGVFRTHNNLLVSVDAARTVREVATLPPGIAGPMICDAKDRIVIGGDRKLVTVDNGQVTVENFYFGYVRDLRVLGDGTLLVLDSAGYVVRWANGARTTLWSMGRPAPALSSIDASGERVLSTLGGRVEIATKPGRHVVGPSALFAVWLDDKTVLFTDRTGMVSRWEIGAPASEQYKVDHVPAAARFIRAQLFRAGERFVVERFDGVMRSISFDRKGVATASAITRVPLGRRTVAAGDAPFAIVAVNDRAYVVDITRPTQAIDITLPWGPVDFLAFSPDGRELAMLAGQDIVVSSIDRSTFRRHVVPSFARGPLLWSGDRTLLVANNAVQIRFNPDGTMDQRKQRTLGFTPAGHPITVTRDRRLVIDRVHSEQVFKIPPGLAAMKVEVTDRHLVLRSARRIEIYALDAPDGTPPIRRTRDTSFLREGTLVGETGILFVDETNQLFLADDTGEHALGKLAGFPLFAVARDRRRVALAMGENITVHDDHGKTIETFAASVGPIRALAWSPNLHTLAVAGRDGVELWTIPR